ncbi:MAG: IclR family transcriptional regulator [Rhodospirillales bacterium]
MDYTITAVDRALSLLEVLAENPGVGVTELANLTGNTKSLVFRLIYTLEQRGYVIKDPSSRTYTLGYRILTLAADTQNHAALINAARPLMDELAQQVQENVNLLVRDGLHSLCVALRESPLPIRLFAQVGRRGPLHVGGGPKVLLAFAPDEVRDAVIAAGLDVHTPLTITDPDRLRTVLDTIRRTNFNESHGDLDAGSFSFAAPVFAAGGQVVAALSVAGPADRLDDAKAETYRRLVRTHAARLSDLMGHRPRMLAAV